ncbi:MAG: hypothetical protein OEX19_09475, partial [Gammaproteobacteria bacterium]|nr:hypothetical protein [Gammaproteobacteria bacterium]
TTTTPTRKRGRGEAVYRFNAIYASYLHLYLPSNPLLGASLFAPEATTIFLKRNEEKVACI